MENNELKSNLARIRELTETVVPLVEIAKLIGDKVYYKVDKGECHGFCLINIPEIAIQHASMGPDSTLVCHDHSEIEIITLYLGDLRMEFETKTVRLAIGEPLVINPNTPHIAKSTNGCKLIGITIPSSKGYPHATE